MQINTDGLERYIESLSVDHKLLIKAESNELKESLQRIPARLKESFTEDTAEGWWVPISFYNKKNGNGRIYNKRLWENVIRDQRDTFVGCPMLADHPAGDSDGNPKDICGVWLDCKLGDEDRNGYGLVYGLLIPSGRIGEDLKDHLSKGLRIGTSSSGFGKLMKDGVTVDPNTYVIERLADWVLNPSQGTFFSYDENEDSVEDKSIRESEEDSLEEKSNYISNIRDVAERYINCHENPTTDEVVDYVLDTFNDAPFSRETVERFVKDYKLDESKSNIYLNTTKEKVVKDSKITKLEEKRIRRDLESFLEDANKIKDPQERLEEFKEIRSYLEDGACPDLREQVEQKIAESEEFIKTALKEKMEFQEELEIESPKDLKEKLSKISEDVQILEKESQDWKQISEALQTKYSETKAELEKRPSTAYAKYLKAKNEKLSEKLKEQTSKAEASMKELTETCKKLQDEQASLKESIETLTKEKVALEEKVNTVSTESADSSVKLTEALAENETLKAQLDSYKEKVTKLIAITSSQRTKLEEATSAKETLKNLNSKKNEKIKELGVRVKKSNMQLHESMAKAAPVREPNSIELYFESLRKDFGDEILPYKRSILGKKTLAEAKRFFYQDVLQNLNESQEIESMRIPESVSIDVEDRAEAIGANFKKNSMMDRKPKGWY